MYTVTFTLDNGETRADSFDSLATAMYNALEHYPHNANRVEIREPSGNVRAYRLKGW
jgi:hypothetical protein